MNNLRFVYALISRYHLSIELVPHNKVSLLEEYECVGKCVEEGVEALRELLTPRLGEVDERNWLLGCLLLFLFLLY